MKPAAFDYRRPGDLSEALEILAQGGGDARVIAGGQSLVPMMNMRVVSPAILVDINKMIGLCGIDVQDNILRIGPQVRHNDVLRRTSPDSDPVPPIRQDFLDLARHFKASQCAIMHWLKMRLLDNFQPACRGALTQSGA